jgi:hypothetical protein
MSRHLMTMLLSGTIGMTITGCAATSPVMRAQSPAAQQIPAQQAGWHQSYAADSFQSYQDNSPECYAGGSDCYGSHDPNQLINLPFHPVHRNSYTYNAPRGMMYPPAPSQAGVYQYPYYTFRGPTDFFMK